MEERKPIVKVRHYRNREGYDGPQWYSRGYGFVMMSLASERKDGIVFVKDRPKIKGGLTLAWVDINGCHYEAGANCSLKDSFCYALGSTIARGRLRKQLELAGLADMV